jgi:hypothetical protein
MEQLYWTNLVLASRKATAKLVLAFAILKKQSSSKFVHD